MTFKELCDKLGIDPRSPDNLVNILVNGFEKDLDKVPIDNFEVSKISLELENFPLCEIEILL